MKPLIVLCFLCGISYGQTVQTVSATKVGSFSARVNVSVSGEGLVFVDYGTTPMKYDKTEAVSIKRNTDNLVRSYSVDLDSLSPATVYHYRARIKIGQDEFVGEEKTFITTMPNRRGSPRGGR